MTASNRDVGEMLRRVLMETRTPSGDVDVVAGWERVGAVVREALEVAESIVMESGLAVIERAARGGNHDGRSMANSHDAT